MSIVDIAKIIIIVTATVFSIYCFIFSGKVLSSVKKSLDRNSVATESSITVTSESAIVSGSNVTVHIQSE